MKSFRYTAYSQSGREVSGELVAPNPGALEAALQAQGLWLVTATLGHSSDAVASPRSRSRINVKRSDLIQFLVQMSLLLKAGVTLPNALLRLADEYDGRPMGAVAATLHESVSQGIPLHKALASFPRVFDRSACAMVEAGEISGNLPVVFNNLSDHLEWIDQITADVRQALIYPSMVLTAASGLLILLFVVVIPKFVTLLTDLKLELPLLTQITIEISHLIKDAWPALLALLIAFPVLYKISLRNETIARGYDRLLMRMPVFGDLYAMFGFSRFAGNLAMLVRSGISLLRGLEITQQLVGNRAIEGAIIAVRQRVLEGTAMHKAMQEQEIFPKALVAMVATGEQSGNLDFALSSASDYYNKLIPRRIKAVFTIFDPLMMLSLISVIGLIALSVILPILQLWQMK